MKIFIYKLAAVLKHIYTFFNYFSALQTAANKASPHISGDGLPAFDL